MNLKVRVKQKLMNLAIGELAAVAVFWVTFFIFEKKRIAPMISIALSLSILSFVLIQGAVFWWILVKRISQPSFGVKCTGKVYFLLKKLDATLLCAAVPVILLYGTFFTTVISLAVWLFAVIEWINYFKYQLSYSLNPAVLCRYIVRGKLRKSKIAKEMERSV